MSNPEKFGTIAGVTAFVLCIAGGLFCLPFKEIANQGDPEQTVDMFQLGLGLYFLGKGFFVGPMLYLTGKTAARAG